MDGKAFIGLYGNLDGWKTFESLYGYSDGWKSLYRLRKDLQMIHWVNNKEAIC